MDNGTDAGAPAQLSAGMDLGQLLHFHQAEMICARLENSTLRLHLAFAVEKTGESSDRLIHA